jgi:hypothetical protein
MPESSPALPETTEFASEVHGIRLAYPRSWSPTASDEYVLKLVSPCPGESISLDIPKLPPHVPGLIPIGMVVNGYLDDLKKKNSGVAVSPTESMKVSGANARRVRTMWKDAEGSAQSEDAVLVVNRDRVYIFRANAAGSEDRNASSTLDGILTSVQWD